MLPVCSLDLFGLTRKQADGQQLASKLKKGDLYMDLFWAFVLVLILFLWVFLTQLGHGE